MYELIKDYSDNILMQLEMNTSLGSKDDTEKQTILYKPGVSLASEGRTSFYKFRRSSSSRIEFNSAIHQPNKDFSLYTRVRFPSNNTTNYSHMICDTTHTWDDRGFGLWIPRYSNDLSARCNGTTMLMINFELNVWYEVVIKYDATNKLFYGYVDDLINPIFCVECTYSIDSQWRFTINDISSWYDTSYANDMDMDFIRLYDTQIEFAEGFCVCKYYNKLYNPFNDIPLLQDKNIKESGFPKQYLNKLNSNILSNIPERFRILTQNVEDAE